MNRPPMNADKRRSIKTLRERLRDLASSSEEEMDLICGPIAVCYGIVDADDNIVKSGCLRNIDREELAVFLNHFLEAEPVVPSTPVRRAV